MAMMWAFQILHPTHKILGKRISKKSAILRFYVRGWQPENHAWSITGLLLESSPGFFCKWFFPGDPSNCQRQAGTTLIHSDLSNNSGQSRRTGNMLETNPILIQYYQISPQKPWLSMCFGCWYWVSNIIEKDLRGKHCPYNRRKFWRQTSDNMDRWKASVGRVREEKRRGEKIRDEKESEERRSRCAKR